MIPRLMYIIIKPLINPIYCKIRYKIIALFLNNSLLRDLPESIYKIINTCVDHTEPLQKILYSCLNNKSIFCLKHFL